MNYKFNWDDGNVFAVPEKVTESGFKLASGKWVKVLVYMLSRKELPEDPADIGVTAEDVEEALAYWEEQGVIYRTSENATSARRAETVPMETVAEKPAVKILAAVPADRTPAAEKEKIKFKPPKALSPAEIAQRMTESEEIGFLIRSSEGLFCRPLNFEDQRTILHIADYFGFSTDIILMLIGFCCSTGKASAAYIQRVAEGWFEKGITTHEQAEKELLNMQKRSSFESQVQSRLKLPEKITKTQREFIAQWSEWDISLEMVELAYDKTVDAKGKISFGYMNGIIRKWHENGISDVTAAENFDGRPKTQTAKNTANADSNTASSQSAPSFDLQQIMEHAINNRPTI